MLKLALIAMCFAISKQCSSLRHVITACTNAFVVLVKRCLLVIWASSRRLRVWLFCFSRTQLAHALLTRNWILMSASSPSTSRIWCCSWCTDRSMYRRLCYKCVVCNVVWAYMCVQIYFIYGFYGCFLPRSIFIIEVTGASCHMDSILVTLWFGIRSPVAQIIVYCSSGFVCCCLFPNQIKSEFCPPNYFPPTIAIKYQVNII